MKELTKAEEILLLAIWRLKDQAYGVTIRKKIKETTSRDYVYGTLYSSLDQLESKGLILKNKGEPTPQRGGRAKTYYRVTKQGLAALKESLMVNQSVWKDITENSLERDHLS